MPAPEPEPTPQSFREALTRAGIPATPAELERALAAARRLRAQVALLRAWNAEHDDSLG
jgi:hypothetical protein